MVIDENNPGEIFLDEGERFIIKPIEKSKRRECMFTPLYPCGDTLFFFEWQRYRIIVNEPFKLIIGSEVYEAEKLKEDTYMVEFPFENYIGRTDIKILKNGKLIKLKFSNFEVLSEKIAEIYGIKVGDFTIEKMKDIHEKFYKSLLNELIKHSLEIPFTITSPTGFYVEESFEPVSELFAYHFLKDKKDRILSALEEILKLPHKKLCENVELVDFHEACDIDAEVLLHAITKSEYLIKVNNENLTIVKRLNGFAPTKVSQKIKYETFDTPENRFVKSFLRELILWSGKVIEAFSDVPKEKISDIEELQWSLNDIIQSSVFEKVGEMELFPYSSQVLLRKCGYRDVLDLYREFTSYQPFFAELRNAMENKDIPKLYEYWCFFKLVKKLEEIFDCVRCPRVYIRTPGELSERGDVYAVFESGWKLYYNKRLTYKRHSYSVSLKPDYSLFDGNGDLVGVFDAKFKLDVVETERDREEFDELGDEVEKTWSYETWAKLEDVYKMHTYRDALNAKFAIALYPGKRSIFFELNKNKIEDWSLKELIMREDGKVNVKEGVGYLSTRGWLNEE